MARTPKFDDEEILDRAMGAFWQGGWSQTSIRDLELALDLKAPSIYRRFGTKEGLGVAVVDHYVDRVVRRRVDKHLSGDGDPIRNIARFLERSVTESGEGGGLWGCLLTTVSLEAGDPDPALGAALERGLAVIEAGIAREIRRAAELGCLADHLDEGAAVSVLVLAMQGLMSLARGGVPSRSLQRRAREAVSTIAAPERPT